MHSPPSNTLVIDFETYYDDKYSLKKINVIPYVRDTQFHAHGCSIKLNSDPAYWVGAADLRTHLQRLDWNDYQVIAHNALFDCFILADHYRIHPPFLVDTMGIARALLPPGIDLDLDSLAKLLGYGEKIKGTLPEIKGKRHLTQEETKKLREYAIQDAELTYKIYNTLWPHLPDNEKRLLALTIRMGTKSTLGIDAKRLLAAKEEESRAIQKLVDACGVDRAILRSNQKFAEYIIQELNLLPPTKISKQTRKITWAFGKNDLEFIRFKKAHPQHAALWNARTAEMGKGNLKRIDRLLEYSDNGRLPIPMPTKYCGAHTFRWSGTGGINVQNFKRGSETRKSLIAPPNKRVGVADSSQIELRTNMWFAGQTDVLELLRKGDDIYAHTATEHYGYRITKDTHPDERQFGKVIELALGYSMWWPTFQYNAAVGFMGAPPILLDDEEALRTVLEYRSRKAAVSGMWRFLQETILPGMTQKGFYYTHKCVTFKHNEVEMPNGLSLQYPNLEFTEEGAFYGIPGHRRKIYGGLFYENLIQSLARIIVADQMLEIDKLDGVEVVTSTHDEAVSIIDTANADALLEEMLRIMSTPPEWAQDLPLDAEGGHDACYSK